jgi:hypothetical protein
VSVEDAFNCPESANEFEKLLWALLPSASGFGSLETKPDKSFMSADPEIYGLGVELTLA